MSLAEKLISLRKQKGLTQMDLAERLDVSRQSISRWEVGISVPSTENLKVLSELYEVSLDYLLTDNIELFNKYDEHPDSSKSEQSSNAKFQRREFVLGLAIVIALVILAVIISVKLALSQEIEQSRPIEEWTRIESTEDIPYTFSIDP